MTATPAPATQPATPAPATQPATPAPATQPATPAPATPDLYDTLHTFVGLDRAAGEL
jgi:hypothetical protein